MKGGWGTLQPTPPRCIRPRFCVMMSHIPKAMKLQGYFGSLFLMVAGPSLEEDSCMRQRLSGTHCSERKWVQPDRMSDPAPLGRGVGGLTRSAAVMLGSGARGRGSFRGRREHLGQASVLEDSWGEGSLHFLCNHSPGSYSVWYESSRISNLCSKGNDSNVVIIFFKGLLLPQWKTPATSFSWQDYKQEI